MNPRERSDKQVSEVFRALRNDLEYIRAKGLMKDDLHKIIAAFTRRMYVCLTLEVAAVYLIARYVD
jgi:hypothetical protein